VAGYAAERDGADFADLVQKVLVTGALTGRFLGTPAQFGLPPAAVVSIVLFTAAAVWGLTLIRGAAVAGAGAR
jgi:hypothetical protein